MTVRKSLAGKRRGKALDMEKIYSQLDAGMSVKEVANEWGVSRSTLYRRHRSYQEQIRLAQEMEESLPELPDDFP